MFHPLRTGSTLRNHLRPRKAKILIPGLESESVLGLESNSLSPPRSLLVPVESTASTVMNRP